MGLSSKNKEETFDNIVTFTNLLQNQFSTNIKVFRSDNGTEFLNKRINLFCNDKGITHQTSCVYSPQQNGVVERKHRHILNISRSLLFEAGLPLKLVLGRCCSHFSFLNKQDAYLCSLGSISI